MNATSPAASGPAGPHFEGQVGAHYLLSMLTGSEPRGLPGTIIDRVEFQRAAEGRPLDDVIVHAHDPRGQAAVLEVQVKRAISFAPSDAVFRKVVEQIVEASRRPGFWDIRYELAIATAKTSRKIDGAYQEVLTWARQLGSAATFMARVARHGSANPDMRTFVSTFKSHLREAGSPDDDETVWRLLRRLQILVFDFTAQGSASEELARERAAHALHSDDAAKAGNLWATLTELAIAIAASGGDRNRPRLIEDLKPYHFRFAGERRTATARAALAEASEAALSDIGDRVGEARLTRHQHVAVVSAALDQGRYVEIRGDAGVGKSGVLKHFAEQISAEARLIVLSPDRTTPKGWTTMRQVLGFDGTARELLADLAIDGGAILFIDNLDFFAGDERVTVNDLVRDAAKIPGFSVIVTARRDFATEEPNWLPREALDRLGRSEPITIGELAEDEVDELRDVDPGLADLLADNHPARDVTRNLFRLARLVSQPKDEPVSRTEIDMAEQWWRLADGRKDNTHRDRARVLRALAEQALVGAAHLNVAAHTAAAVDALVASETLRDLGNDRVAFRHDVLREWAIANLLSSEPAFVERLPLDRPASASLARGMELTARIALERSPDAAAWLSLLSRVSRAGVHGSWRRAVLLALVRSEIAGDLLTRVSDALLADGGALLRELVRTVMAVDVTPAAQIYVSAGIDPAMIPAGLNVPSGASYLRLIMWLLGLGQNLPVKAIPDIVELYTGWSGAMLGRDALTPMILQWLFHWLTQVEAVNGPYGIRNRDTALGRELDDELLRTLESDLRTGFLLFCDRTPELAATYLRSLGERRRGDSVVGSILKFRGMLAKAAPVELAELTTLALIPPRDEEEDRRRRDDLRQPFDYVSCELLPASPAQGPFLELLTHSPEQGLALIRRLVDHAISFHTNGHDHGSNAITLSLPDVDRTFLWKQSYYWSRDGYAHYVLTSALMALEAWAHQRIEAGEDFGKVLADVLGPSGTPAAYLLVAVDLMLSHWPKPREAAVPFLGNPELLSLDRARYVHDNQPFDLDIFGLKALQKEPRGAATIASLSKRPSRRCELYDLLGQYAVHGPADLRQKLQNLLRLAAERFGDPTAESTLRDPALMAQHALNVTDPNNWSEVLIKRDDGTEETARQYVAPEAERQHFAHFQTDPCHLAENMQMRGALTTALTDPTRSSAEFAAAAVEWAKKPMEADADADAKKMHDEAVLTAAMVAMRDGSPELREGEAAWAHDLFSQAMHGKEDVAHSMRAGLQFNPVAIAFVGLIHLLRDRSGPTDLRAMLEVVGRGNPALARGFPVAANTLAAVDERLPKAVLRCALATCIRPQRKWDLSEDETAARSDRCHARIQQVINAEMAWLAGDGPEPDWPAFPAEPARRRPGIRLPGGKKEPVERKARPVRPDEYVDHRAAALWLGASRSLSDVVTRPWVRDLVRAYATWTAAANGAGLVQHDQISEPPYEWNNVYFDLLAHCLAGMAEADIDELALAPIVALPDEPFFEVATLFLRAVDDVYFNDRGLQERGAVHIRAVLADRLVASSGWRQLVGKRSDSIEVHIGPAIAVFFWNDHNRFQPTKAYLLPKGIDRLRPFLPVLEKLAVGAPCPFVALVTLNLLEVSPKPEYLPFLVAAAEAWLTHFPNDSGFWCDFTVGRRICTVLDNLREQQPPLLATGQPLRRRVDDLLAALIRLGVAEATRLEKTLADIE